MKSRLSLTILMITNFVNQTLADAQMNVLYRTNAW